MPRTHGATARDHARVRVPHYLGAEFCDMPLPATSEPWPRHASERECERSGDHYDASREQLVAALAGKPFVWPRRTMYFFCDVHADADAWRRSLIASGGVRWLGPGDDEYELSEAGRSATFVIAGDLFDKGPSTLRLLRAVKRLIDRGADVRILAGNHDLRTFVGLTYLGHADPRFAHLFVRMGKKTIPLFREIRDTYLEPGAGEPASEQALRELLFPSERWFSEFPAAAAGLMPAKKVVKEVQRVREKMAELPERCEQLGLSLGDVHRAAQLATRLFLAPDGEFRWLLDHMRLAERWGSLLLVHAGVGDGTAALLAETGIDGVNARFDQLLREDMFQLYFGELGNMFRTKYRDVDWPFTAGGVAAMHRAGLYGVVHGHHAMRRGQRVVMREGLLNFECDASVDINTRKRDGLEGPGGAVVVFQPDGVALAISADHPHAKLFDATTLFPLLTLV